LPNIKAAIKWQRQTERRTLRNLDLKTRLKTLFKKAKATPEQASSVEAQFDKAARKKARLARAIRTAKALAAAAPVATATVAKKRGTKKK
jgi:ribosomal protein S20